MQCPVCHAEVGSQNAFCTNCGSALSAASPAPQQPAYEPVSTPAYSPVPPASAGNPPPPPQGAPAALPINASGLSDTAAGAIAYITIIPAIIFLTIDPYKKIPFVRFHSFQSIWLAVACAVTWIAIIILQFVLHFIPFISVLFILVDIAVDIGFFVAWLIAIIKASKGEWFKLPFIGDFADKMARG